MAMGHQRSKTEFNNILEKHLLPMITEYTPNKKSHQKKVLKRTRKGEVIQQNWEIYNQRTAEEKVIQDYQDVKQP